MLYKPYGKTGKMVSAVGFGGMRFDTALSNEKNADLVLYAREQGINYFDTAPGYCSDKSEDIMGIAMRQMRRETFFCSTKGMPTQFKTVQKAYDAARKSRDRLGVEKIDFYHIWCLKNMDEYSLAMQEGGQYEGLLKAQQDGIIEHIVCSSHQPGHEIRKIVEDGKVEGVLMGINILNFPYRWDGVEACNKAGLGVVAMNPLGGGAIPSHEKELSFLSGNGETPTQAALRFTISSPQITIALNGFTTREHVDMAVRIADEAVLFTPEELDDIRTHLGENLNAACTGCGYCRNCPKGINVPGYMQVYNERQMFNVPEEKMGRIIKNEKGWGRLVGAVPASECIACGQCESACTQHLNIIERLAQMDRWEHQAE